MKKVIEKICETEEIFAKSIFENISSLERANKIFEHERAHFNIAKKLKYKPIYRVKLFKNKKNELILETDVYILEGFRLAQDAIKIALAPENPSETDYALAREYGWKEKKK